MNVRAINEAKHRLIFIHYLISKRFNIAIADEQINSYTGVLIKDYSYVMNESSQCTKVSLISLTCERVRPLLCIVFDM